MRCTGAGGVEGSENGSGMGGMGRGYYDLLEGLKGTPNHPDRLLMGGLLGPRRGGTGEEAPPLIPLLRGT